MDMEFNFDNPFNTFSCDDPDESFKAVVSDSSRANAPVENSSNLKLCCSIPFYREAILRQNGKRHRGDIQPHTIEPQVDRFHQPLKAAIMARGNAQWTTVLLTLLMGFRATWKEGLLATTAEMIYGAPIWLPGEFLCPSKPSADPVTFVGRLRDTPDIMVNIQSS
ncbi:integrase catalytic domain-containing protein [Trichonephila clavata]|uniref:Integrase catalytic domain-containing protein n=1 Tax=Trichonephila clavata TaxID=2740835 RepID=A0A8X6FN65_TRICU|nr:integrase catalytic domain-containing protein [Trichonephila clavata]